MVSCAANLFRRKWVDETFGAKSRGISIYGKYGAGVLMRAQAPGTYFGGLRLVARHPCRARGGEAPVQGV
ncbi:protein of unknown function [Bradyrhizobium vignae]|uniref:Uncharacterized protein n=1 Tax=Bradyrhizobium vignae TaxID=1549949 RepID=A0A2U3QD57_9BRAD|nr:protein of unknown function [Bradyrhizobium vignae]